MGAAGSVPPSNHNLFKTFIKTMGETHSKLLQEGSMKNVTAFTTAAEVIAKEMAQTGDMSYDRAAQILHMYENAFTVVKKHFPGAECGTDILFKADQVLVERGCTGDNTLYAQSICPDEINHESGDITELFSKHMGEVFHMGGLGGIPFTGKTGFAAFSHHVPDDGNLFILFAPHIGISNSGELGKYTRSGQNRDGTACGAACGALKFCEDCKFDVEQSTKFGTPNTKKIKAPGEIYGDYQMEFIISQINARLGKICSQPTEDSKQAALVYEMFNIAKEFIDKVINFDETGAIRKPSLFLLGGIQINMPKPMPDFFMPLLFEERNADGTVLNLMESTFGQK